MRASYISHLSFIIHASSFNLMNTITVVFYLLEIVDYSALRLAQRLKKRVPPLKIPMVPTARPAFTLAMHYEGASICSHNTQWKVNRLYTDIDIASFF